MNEKIDLVSLPKKSFWKLSLPIIAFCIFDAIYGIVDMVWVSKISIEAFFAIGVSIPFVSLIFSFGDSIGQGTNSIMSRFIGSGDYESAYNSLIHGMLVSNIICLFIILCALFAQGILFYINQAQTYILAFDYLIPIVVFAYIFIFVNLFSETLQAEGNSRIPTIVMISCNILNMILDPIFIFNLNLGIKGAAYATVLSALIGFIAFLFIYLSGRTKVPLSLKYFKFRSYILIEIVKVALPNFLDNGLWAFSASFINAMLITTTGEIGPILYSITNKIKTLLVSPTRGYGRALMSVTGHLFGAHKFDELNKMYKYVIEVSFITTLVVMIAFIIVRDYAFSLFSINGMETEVFWIAIFGTIMMLTIPFSMISGKMLDGFGKSMYSLFFTVVKIGLEVAFIYGLYITLLPDGRCVLIGLTVSEILSAIIYYLFLRHLFKNFDKEYKDKKTVKTFDSDDENRSSKDTEDKVTGNEKNKIIKRIPLIIGLIALSIVVIEILYLPIKLNNFPLLIGGIFSLIIGAFSIYLMERLNKPMLSIFGFISAAVILFIFMGKHGYISTLLFVVTAVLILYIKLIVKKLKNE
ncbi:MATE family efflux transporter [uncultured Methanobrevibacter sp.]|uniref:MATE family efflux transporter n=1 Tax=uncultured Methanobrevibacter sp. TaxID=253161 RepID=UPI0025F2FD61|nr:MATE family efflux transporter [uncultured Methanobrevibacter sp.]